MIDREGERTPDTGQDASTIPVMTARQAAGFLGVNERTIRRAIARGHIPARKRSGRFRIQKADLVRYRQHSIRTVLRSNRLPNPIVLLPQLTAEHPFEMPIQRSTLLGRGQELDAVRALLLHDDVPLVTLTGSGGVGKTQLAIATAAQLRDHFVNGIWFVDLSSLRDPDLVPATIAHALEIREVAGLPAINRLRTFLEQRRVLLVLDNFEQVVAGGVDIAVLLTSCPGLTILVTSRVPLHLSVEHQYPVSPLLVPVPGDSLGKVSATAAVQLFTRKARSVQPDFSVTAGNAPAVSAICARLDGLPLAIELAAARSNVLSPPALLARLDNRLPLLTGGPLDLPPRLRSMRDAISWSYDLLDDSRQQLFRRLAVFAGGFTEEAAAFVELDESDGESTPILHRLTALVENNLLIATDHGDGNPRFTMLATIQEFGLEELDRHQETAAMRDRHATWVRDLIPYDTLWWYTGVQKHALDTLEREHDNLRAALSWFTQTGDQAAVVRLVGMVWPFWSFRGHWGEGVGWLRRAQAWTEGHRTLERVRVLNGAGYVWMWLGDEPAATVFLEESRSICDEIGNVSPFDRSDAELAIAANIRGDFDESLARFNQVLAALRALGDSDPRAMPGVSTILMDMGWLELTQGTLDRAEALANEALAIHRTLGMDSVVYGTLCLLGGIAIRRGDYWQATGLLREGLKVGWEQRDPQYIVGVFTMLAEVDRDTGHLDRAALLLGAGSQLRSLLGGYPADRMVTIEQLTNDIRSRMGEPAFSEAWEAGRELSTEEAIAIASQVEIAAPPSGIPPGIARLGITPRELDVLCLLAEGRTDREIADALFLSRRTVNSHVSHLLSKFEVSTRTHAVALARDEHLLLDCPSSTRPPRSC